MHLSPEQAKQLPAAIHTDFLQAFAHALHGVFLFGMALAVIPFVLSLFLTGCLDGPTLWWPA